MNWISVLWLLLDLLVIAPEGDVAATDGGDPLPPPPR